MKNLYIIGFMGTGKTSSCKLLAKKLDKDFVDMDARIQVLENMSVAEIFRQKGELYFRSVEKKLLLELSLDEDQIISCGGGIIIDPDNIRLMRQTGIVICLYTDPEVVFERTKGLGERPLLDVEDPLLAIKKLMEQRKGFYERAAHHWIDTTSLTVQETADKISEAVKNEL